MGGIVGGLLLKGGKIRDVAQITAAIIVLGGTFGAVMINTPPHVIAGALKRARDVFLYSAQGPEAIIEEIIAEAKVFECASGYAPTIGIIGAVVGLIRS